MTHRELVILLGLALAACGHVLVHELRPATATWTRLDELFPAAWRTPPSLAGACLLMVGALCVVVPVLG